MTKCHTSTVRVARIRKRVAASSECTGEDKGSAGARRTGESVWVRRPSASDPGLGGEPTDRSSLRSSAMHHDRSLPDTLNEAVQLCEPVFEEAQMEPRRGAHKAEPRRKSPAARDASPAFALPMDDNFDWSAALLRVPAHDAGDGVVDETRIRTGAGARRGGTDMSSASPLARASRDDETPSRSDETRVGKVFNPSRCVSSQTPPRTRTPTRRASFCPLSPTFTDAHAHDARTRHDTTRHDRHRRLGWSRGKLG